MKATPHNSSSTPSTGASHRSSHLKRIRSTPSSVSHQPPLVFFKQVVPGKPSLLELSNGGTVIGPLPQARFRRGFARLHPGEVLLLLTDGILERRDRRGEFFGDDRVRELVRQHEAQPAAVILERLFEAALAWGDGRAWEDDATIVVVKRGSA